MSYSCRLYSKITLGLILAFIGFHISGCSANHFRVEKRQSDARIDHKQRFAILPLSYVDRPGTLVELRIRDSVSRSALVELEGMGYATASWEKLEGHLQSLHLETKIIDRSILENEPFLEMMKNELEADAILVIEVLQWTIRKILANHLRMNVSVYDLDQRQYIWSWNVDIKQPKPFLLIHLDVNQLEHFQQKPGSEAFRKVFFEIVNDFSR